MIKGLSFHLRPTIFFKSACFNDGTITEYLQTKGQSSLSCHLDISALSAGKSYEQEQKI
jgi:hypothetical protein